MITLDAFLQGIQENIARITHYESGGDGRGGGCDCIGLIIGAIRLAGGSWPGTHGSNWAARNEMRAFGQVSVLYLGEIVYKAKSPGEAGYDLPEKYKSSGDLLDYYHVGVVTGVNPLVITHCTSVPGGIKQDNQPGAWRYGGQLKMVDYGGDEQVEVLYEARVTAASGRTVNLRANPSDTATVLKTVPVGSSVDVLDDADPTWAKIRWMYYDGYMMKKFLVKETPAETYEALKEARDSLAHALAIIEGLMGGGVG